MIRIVAGTSGSGKTYLTRQRAAALAKEGQRAALLVPEQFSFETERAMLELLPPAYADRVEVYSFTRLAAKLDREAGGIAGRRLDECGRAAVMQAALSSVRDYLTLYGGKRGKEPVAHLLAAVGEFKSCAITPEMLGETARRVEESVLRQKLEELSLIYGAYNAVIAGLGSVDPLDDLTRLARNLDDIPYFDGMEVFIDSFTGFTRQELNVLERVIRQCDGVTVTLCCEQSDGQREGSRMDVFASVRQTARQLAAFDSDVTWEYLTEKPRFRSGALGAVERGVFRTGRGECFDRPTDDAVLYAAADKYDEAEFTAREIRRLIREKGYRRRDFAIICRTASDYETRLLRAMAMQDIPCFCDRRIPVTDLPLARFVLAALDIVTGRRRTEDILRWLKTGMVKDIGAVDIARLENYCFVWNVRGGDWRKPFTQSPYGMSDRPAEGEEELLAQINAVRERVDGLLTPLESSVRQEGATGKDMAAALWKLIDEAGAAERIESLLPRLSPTDADAQGQVWNAVMNLLDQLAAILGDTPVGFREFSELLTLMLGACDVGRIPQGMDEAVFGAADRIRTASPKVVFVLGANDGVFPLTPSSNGVFTDNERRLLIERQLPLAGDGEDEAVSEQFLAYAAMTCASEKLYVTYSRAEGGEALYPSEIVGELRRILPRCAVKETPPDDAPERVEAPEAGFLTAAACLGQEDAFSRALTQCYAARDEYADRLEVVRRANAREPLALRNSANARALFGSSPHISASRAECFYQCKFMYFCRYGMKATPRRRAELDSLEYGSVVHYVLEKLLAEHDVSELASERRARELIEPYLEAYLNEVMGGAEMKSSRFLYLYRRLADTLAELAAGLGEEFARSLFAPYAFELPIGEDGVKPLRLPLDDGTHITVDGKIDRVDIFTKDGVKYVRVVDYKTGSKEFVLSDILAGLNMQMLIYLDILCDPSLCGEGFAPAGVIYSPASLRKVSGVRGETEYADARQEMLRKNGLILDDPDVIDAMETGMEKKVDKQSNATVKGGKTFHGAATCVAGQEQLDHIRAHVRALLREMGQSLHRGEIAPDPAKGTYDACAYCDYRALCSQERKSSGREIRKLPVSEVFRETDGE